MTSFVPPPLHLSWRGRTIFFESFFERVCPIFKMSQHTLRHIALLFFCLFFADDPGEELAPDFFPWIAIQHPLMPTSRNFPLIGPPPSGGGFHFLRPSGAYGLIFFFDVHDCPSVAAVLPQTAENTLFAFSIGRFYFRFVLFFLLQPVCPLPDYPRLVLFFPLMTKILIRKFSFFFLE